MSDETGRGPTDEELAEIMYESADLTGWPSFETTNTELRSQYLRMARAVRVALAPPVPPLAPGEHVMIPDGELPGMALLVQGGETSLSIAPTKDGACLVGPYYLDAAGIAALETACRRARATLAGGA